ncbi:MAG: ABC transporter substrate-binding protein [Chloroflexota bacterium]
MDLEGAVRRIATRRAFLLGAVGATAASVLAACSQPAQPAATIALAAPTTAKPAPAAAASPSGAASPAASPSTSPAVASPVPAASPAVNPAASPAVVASPSAVAAGAPSATIGNPPPFAGAAAAKQFSSQVVSYYGDSVGLGHDIDTALTTRFTQDSGIKVNLVPKPASATDTFAQYQRFFQGQSPDLDVLMIDVIWPGSLGQHLVDLTPKLGDAAKQHYSTIIDNNTVDGKLVGMPWFGDFGMLFYRKDLLQKYNISAPPKTWDELEQQAKTIVDGEKSGNPNFAGFVYQGNAYEGLTCNALEWIASSGGGNMIEPDKSVTINNPQTVAILNKLKGWVGTISPRGVTGYQEDESLNAFAGNNAAFMRNWPYAWGVLNKDDSALKGKVDVAPLPAGPGQKSSGTVGGWQLGVSKYSKNQDASIEFVRYLTSPEVQAYRAVVGSYVPTIGDVAGRPEVLQVQPFLKNLQDVVRVVRPSKVTADRYNEASTAIFQGVNQILNGQDAAQALPGVQQRLQRLTA